MQRQRGELIPVAEALADLPGPVQALIPSPPKLPHKVPPRVEEDQDRLAGSELRNEPWRPDPASFDPDDRAGWTSPTHKLITRFRAVSGASAALVRRVGL